MVLISRISVACLFILCFLSINAGDSIADEKLPVFVSIVPQKTFVQQIGKDRVAVQVLVQPGASPHTYEPSPRQMAAISNAQIYFAIGVGFENKWLNKISAANPKMKVVHTDQGIDKIPISDHLHHDHDEDRDHHGEAADSHAEEKELHEEEDHRHDRGGLDPHIWLSPPLVMQQARTIRNALQEIDPHHRSVYEANYQQFVSSIAELDTKLQTIFADKQGLQFMVFHPAWGYFAHAYGLEQIPVEIEGKSPKPAQLKGLIDHAKERGIKVIFVQPQFSTKSAALIAREISGQVVFADPLAEQWSANLNEVAGKFKAALR